MTQASLHSQESQALYLSDEEVSSIKSQSVPRVTASKKMADKSTEGKTKSKPRSMAKLDDLTALENKLSGQIESRFSSLDGRLERLIGLLDTSGCVQRRPIIVDNSTSGACEPLQTQRNDTLGVREPLISLENSLNRDFGLESHSMDDVLSLQPGQKERRGIGLLSSEDRDNSSCVEIENAEQITESRFGKYSNSAQSSSAKENEPLTHDMLIEMFGEDAQAVSSATKTGLCLDKAQIEILNNSWRCQVPDKLSAYKESSKQSFPVSESAAKILQVPSLDELSERLLIKKHGRKAAFGSSQSLFSQPYKSMEKIAYQGQIAARLGIISLCYTQQALGLLLSNLKKDSPNIDEAVQTVRDIFAMTTKSLDQVARTGAFHHLIRRKATVADTGLHEFKDLQKTSLTAPLSGEGIFGAEFEKKLKDRQEKDKQLSDLMPEVGKKFFNKRKSSYPSESAYSKRPRQSDNSFKSYRSTDSSFGYNKNPRNSGYTNRFRGNSKSSSSVSSFRPQGDKSRKA